jgi:non-heme chloroperoxidase
MAHLKVGEENGSPVNIYYEDRGSGKPVVLIHGWPLDGGSWEKQSFALLAAGYRVITYDRRGFGRSSAPSEGYDYNTMAGDLDKLIEALDLKDAAIVGFSMGGGEVARYMGKYNQGRVTKAVFMSSIAPALRKDGNNPDGVPPEIFEGIKQKIEKDRFDFLESFANVFYNHSLLSSTHTSGGLLHHFQRVGALSSYGAMLACVDAWLEDFRDDVKSIQVPTLVIHGDSDKIVPLENSGARIQALVPTATLHIVEGGPHGVNWTHATEVNKALLSFLKA